MLFIWTFDDQNFGCTCWPHRLLVRRYFDRGISSCRSLPSLSLVLPSFSPRSPLVLPSFSPRSPLVLPSFSPRSPLVLPSFSPRSPLVLLSSHQGCSSYCIRKCLTFPLGMGRPNSISILQSCLHWKYEREREGGGREREGEGEGE